MNTVNPTASKTKRKAKKKSKFLGFCKRFARNKMAVVAFFIICLIVLAAIFADYIAPYDYAKQDYYNTFAYPSAEHPFGTDNYGRDLLSRIIKGAQISLIVSLCAVLSSGIVGVALGSTAGYFGGTYGTIVMRVVDIMMSIPPLLMAVSISAALGSGVVNTIIAVAISTMPTFVRTMYAAVLAEKDREYIEAATACGAKSFRKIITHIIPNTMAPIIIAGSLRIGLAIMTISSLSFVGLGVQPPTPEWGSIMSVGRQFIRDFYPIIIFPGLAIAVTVISFNIFADGLRDALDPRLKR